MIQAIAFPESHSHFPTPKVKNLPQFLYSGGDAGASINTPNIGNSALIIEELDWGDQDALNTCENSFFGPHLGLGRQKMWSDLDKPLMWSCHIYFRKFALFILESFLLGVALCNLESFFS